MCEILQIEDDAELARHIKAPLMLSEEQEALMWPNVFEFPGGQPESLFWLKHINLSDVHAKGCEWQVERRKAKPRATYRGVVVAQASGVRSFRSARGHGFILVHDPVEGVFHVHISYDATRNVEFNKQDKIELRYALSKIFFTRVDHECP